MSYTETIKAALIQMKLSQAFPLLATVIRMVGNMSFIECPVNYVFISNSFYAMITVSF